MQAESNNDASDFPKSINTNIDTDINSSDNSTIKDKDTREHSSELLQQMTSSVNQASQLLKSLSHPDRLLLLCQLTKGEYCVHELQQIVCIEQPSLSQQLGILRKEGLVSTRRKGKRIYYTIASEDAEAVLQLLYQRFCS